MGGAVGTRNSGEGGMMLGSRFRGQWCLISTVKIREGWGFQSKGTSMTKISSFGQFYLLCHSLWLKTFLATRAMRSTKSSVFCQEHKHGRERSRSNSTTCHYVTYNRYVQYACGGIVTWGLAACGMVLLRYRPLATTI